jgi:hypothetical protein
MMILLSGMGSLAKLRGTTAYGRQAPRAGRPSWPDQPRRWCQDSLQQPVEWNPAGDHALRIVQMLAPWLRRVADGPLSTPSGHSGASLELAGIASAELQLESFA